MTSAHDGPASKAAGFTTVSTILAETAGPSEFERFVNALPPATAELVRIPPSATTWLPIENFYALVDTAHRHLFAGEISRVEELGFASIGRDLKFLYRLIVRVSSAEAMLSRAARLWDAYNRNHGAVSVEMRSRTVADVTYEWIPAQAPAAFWAFQRGGLRAVLEATGVKNARARMLAPRKGPGPCTIRVSGERDLDD